MRPRGALHDLKILFRQFLAIRQWITVVYETLVPSATVTNDDEVLYTKLTLLSTCDVRISSNFDHDV